MLSADGRLLHTRKNHRLTTVWAQRSGGWVLVYCHDEHGRPGLTPAGVFDSGVELKHFKVESKRRPDSGK